MDVSQIGKYGARINSSGIVVEPFCFRVALKNYQRTVHFCLDCVPRSSQRAPSAADVVESSDSKSVSFRVALLNWKNDGDSIHSQGSKKFVTSYEHEFLSLPGSELLSTAKGWIKNNRISLGLSVNFTEESQ